MNEQYYIGWDVGAWSCTNAKRSSCDALVILNHEGELIGEPYRQSLKLLLNEDNDVEGFLQRCFALCDVEEAYQGEQVCLAIDAPLGYSTAFIELITGYTYHEEIDEYKYNPYLFRATERHLYEEGIINKKGNYLGRFAK